MEPASTPERALRAELMDRPDLEPAAGERALTDLERVTRWSGGLLPVLRVLVPLLVRGPRRQTLLDLGSGSGQVPATVTAAAGRRGVTLVCVGCDRKLQHLAFGRRRGHRQHRVVADVEALPFADRSFDWTTSTLLLHHFDSGRNRHVLEEMLRTGRRGAVVIDLRRSRLARALFDLLALVLALGPVARYDGRLSLEQAWTRPELVRLTAGMPVVELRRRFPFRLSLVLSPARGGPAPAAG